MYPQSMSKNKKNIKHFLLKIFIFMATKISVYLHGQVFVMTGFQMPSNGHLKD